jgi:hypothetical protein
VPTSMRNHWARRRERTAVPWKNCQRRYKTFAVIHYLQQSLHPYRDFVTRLADVVQPHWHGRSWRNAARHADVLPSSEVAPICLTHPDREITQRSGRRTLE